MFGVLVYIAFGYFTDEDCISHFRFVSCSEIHISLQVLSFHASLSEAAFDFKVPGE